ncbi:Ig-like domain-containing protein [Actinoplanes sp. NEAU-A12]|uniref:Ig-like domain-containing protein n=1 Tax=Actinoplanes sandaracinus TaxID=3045177 RepID=A0ABT6WCM6_9ACTN|nr:Ig-like domain-containing protein [Actinoplanes sandaracinus]MDI6097484.1 Ig-like domain-containing protein [Actinoplanes sandaracinus]
MATSPSSWPAGKNARLTVQVTTASGVVPAGTVRIVAVRSTTEIVRTVRLDSRGKAVLDLGPLAKGTYKITGRTPVRRP